MPRSSISPAASGGSSRHAKSGASKNTKRSDWWDFVGAEERSVAYQKLLAIGITRSLVAAKARSASVKTIGDIFVQLLFGILVPGIASDRLLNGPTN